MAEIEKKKSAKDKCRILTPEFRVAFPKVMEPQSFGGGEPKFSITMLYKKTQDLSKLTRALKQAKINEFGPDKSEWPKGLDTPVEDGDDFPDRDGYKGCWVFKATSNKNQRPGVVDEEGEPITDAAGLYPGCYAHAWIFARVWEFPKGSKKYGLQFILDHVQKRRDGKAFGGKKPVGECFGPLDLDSEEDEDGDEE